MFKNEKGYFLLEAVILLFVVITISFYLYPVFINMEGKMKELQEKEMTEIHLYEVARLVFKSNVKLEELSITHYRTWQKSKSYICIAAINKIGEEHCEDFKLYYKEP